jgi:hypothetical protein
VPVARACKPDVIVICEALVMQIDVLFAGIPTSDPAPAIEWSSSLLGRPPDMVPNDDEVMWRLNDAAWLLILTDAERDGTAVVNVAVPDLDVIGEIAERGKFSLPIETVEGTTRKAQYQDWEGNSITFLEGMGS